MKNDKSIRTIASQDKQGNQVLMIVKGNLTTDLLTGAGYVNDPETSPIVDQLKQIMDDCIFREVNNK